MAGSSVMMRFRMLKRLQKIKNFLGDATTKEEVKKKVAIDWYRYEYSGVGKKDHVIIIHIVLFLKKIGGFSIRFLSTKHRLF